VRSCSSSCLARSTVAGTWRKYVYSPIANIIILVSYEILSKTDNNAKATANCNPDSADDEAMQS